MAKAKGRGSKGNGNQSGSGSGAMTSGKAQGMSTAKSMLNLKPSSSTMLGAIPTDATMKVAMKKPPNKFVKYAQ